MIVSGLALMSQVCAGFFSKEFRVFGGKSMQYTWATQNQIFEADLLLQFMMIECTRAFKLFVQIRWKANFNVKNILMTNNILQL